MAESRSVASLFVLAMVWLLVAASPAKCEFINPPVLHDSLKIRYYDPTYGWSSYAARGSALWKNVVYISGWPSDNNDDPIYSIDVSNPDNLAYITRTGGSDVYYFNQMFPYEDKLFVAGWGDMLRNYAIISPGFPSYQGHYDRPCQPDPNDPNVPLCYFGWGIKVVGNRVYLTEASEKTKGIYIIDVSNLSSPTEVSRMELAESPGGIAVRGSYLFYGYNHYGSSTPANYFSLRVANISDETNPQTISVTDFTSIGPVGDIVLRGNIAYVSCGGIMAIDISNPTSPTLISRCNTGSGQLLLLGDYAFIATGGNGCQFVNIANPANMFVVYAVYHGSPREYEEAVVGNGRYVYVSTTCNKLVEDPPYNVLEAYEVFDADPDDTGPRTYSNLSLGEAPWDLQYECDAVPISSNPAWTLIEGSNSMGSICPSPCSGGVGGVLRINDNTTGDKVKWAINWDATNTRGTTVLTRARCASHSANGSLGTMANIFIRDGRFCEEFAILSDRLRSLRTATEYFLDGTAWHTYRFTTKGIQFKVYVDEAASPVMTGTLYADYNTDPEARRARLWIGSGSTQATQDIYFDYVHAFSNGEFAPTPLLNTQTPAFTVNVADVAGRGSLSGINPATARVMWSIDGGLNWNVSGPAFWQTEYTGDALPSVSTPSWTVPEGSEIPWASVAGGLLRVNDTSTAGNTKVKWARSWNASPATGTTLLARARCVSVGGDTSLLGNLFVEDGAKAEQFKIMPDRLVAYNAGLTYFLDGTQFHVYRVTTKNTQFSVYVDEQATPVMTGTLATATSNNRVMFGSGASAGTQDIYFDYVKYTGGGELPPGLGNGGSAVTVNCTPINAVIPADRGTITTSGVPFNENSHTLNKVRFALDDLAGNTGFSPVFNVRTEIPLPDPDWDNDGDVDQEDFGEFQKCFSGPGIGYAPSCFDADLDLDNDVDSVDFTSFNNCMAGPNNPPGC